MYGHTVKIHRALALNIFVTIPWRMNDIIQDMTVESIFMIIFRKMCFAKRRYRTKFCNLIHLFQMDTPLLKNTMVLVLGDFQRGTLKVRCPKGFEVLTMECLWGLNLTFVYPSESHSFNSYRKDVIFLLRVGPRFRFGFETLELLK